MALGIPILLAAGGAVALLVATTRKAAAAPPPGAPPTPTPEVEALPYRLKQQMARAMQHLGVDDVGNIVPPVDEAAIQAATTVASQLEDAGFPLAGATLREYAKRAGAYIKTPPLEQQVPVPGLTPEQQAVLNRVLRLEGDPRRLRQLADLLRMAPNAKDPQVQAAIEMLEAKAAQIEAQKATAEAVKQTEEVITSPGLPKPAVPVVAPPPPPPVSPPPSPPPGVVPTPVVTRPPTPALPPTPVKTPVQSAAEAMVLHLRQLQARYDTVKKAKGNEDKALVMRFQTKAGLKPDGKAGPGTLVAAARADQSELPLVMYWPTGATAKTVNAYRAELYDLADAAEAANKTQRAVELRASAQRERGQAGIVGTMPK